MSTDIQHTDKTLTAGAPEMTASAGVSAPPSYSAQFNDASGAPKPLTPEQEAQINLRVGGDNGYVADAGTIQSERQQEVRGQKNAEKKNEKLSRQLLIMQSLDRIRDDLNQALSGLKDTADKARRDQQDTLDFINKAMLAKEDLENQSSHYKKAIEDIQNGQEIDRDENGQPLDPVLLEAIKRHQRQTKDTKESYSDTELMVILGAQADWIDNQALPAIDNLIYEGSEILEGQGTLANDADSLYENAQTARAEAETIEDPEEKIQVMKGIQTSVLEQRKGLEEKRIGLDGRSKSLAENLHSVMNNGAIPEGEKEVKIENNEDKMAQLFGNDEEIIISTAQPQTNTFSP